MSQEIVLCGKLQVIMKCGLRTHYQDFIDQTTTQVCVLFLEFYYIYLFVFLCRVFLEKNLF